MCEFSHRLPWKLGSVWNYALKDLVLPCYRLWELIWQNYFLSNFVTHASLQEKQSLKKEILLWYCQHWQCSKLFSSFNKRVCKVACYLSSKFCPGYISEGCFKGISPLKLFVLIFEEQLTLFILKVFNLSLQMTFNLAVEVNCLLSSSVIKTSAKWAIGRKKKVF